MNRLAVVRRAKKGKTLQSATEPTTPAPAAPSVLSAIFKRKDFPASAVASADSPPECEPKGGGAPAPDKSPGMGVMGLM